MEENYAIIVAGGSGKRMETETPKQFLPIHGRPVLMHTLERFHRFDPSLHLIVVLPKAHIPAWERLCRDHGCSLLHRIVSGGAERFHSVRNALETIPPVEGLIAIHDGVRPLVSDETIQTAFDTARRFGNAVPVIPVTDSVREERGSGNIMIDRSHLRLIQTPQVFKNRLIHQAYQQPFSSLFTDDASVLEQMGEQIRLTPGNPENIKITRPVDLIIASALFNKDC